MTPTETKRSVHGRKDFKSERLKKLGWDCSPTFGKIISRASAKSAFFIFLVLLLGSFTFLHFAGEETKTKWKFTWVRTVYDMGRDWRYVKGLFSPAFVYKGLIPPYFFDSRDCLSASESANSVPSKSIKTTAAINFRYDVCLAVSIGDDGDAPNNRAVPYPLVSRLTDALKEEVESLQKNESRPNNVTQVLVGADYGSVVCLIVRDTFREVPDSQVQCRTFSEIDQGTKCGKLVVGTTARFVPQVPEEWSEAVEWQSRRLVDLDCTDPSHEPPSLEEKDWQPTIVTGFSSNHETVGLLLLRSIGRAVKEAGGGLNVSVVVWAMEDFNPEHQRLLDCVMDELRNEYGVKVELRVFDWAAWPSWMRINQTLGYFGGTGEYAWKAIMIHTVLRERGLVLWADAGNRFTTTESLVETLKTLKSTGFVSLHSDGTVYTRTYPLHLKYWRANIPEIWDMGNCEAAIIGYTLKKYREFARPWYDCCMTRQCIAPDGSHHGNHRQDQSALTVLSILSNNPCAGRHPDFRVHEDKKKKDLRGAYKTKCYDDPLDLHDQGTLDPSHHPHGIID